MHETFDVSLSTTNNDDNVPRIGEREIVPSPDVVHGGRLFPDDPLLVRKWRRTCVVVDNATVNYPTNLQSLNKDCQIKSYQHAHQKQHCNDQLQPYLRTYLWSGTSSDETREGDVNTYEQK